MKAFCVRFRNSILFLMKLLLYGGSFLIFFGMLGIENRQVRVLSRTSVITAIMYVLAAVIFSRIYGGFEVGIRKRRDVTLSVELSLFLTSLAAYFILLIMSVNDANQRRFRLISPGFFLLSLLLQGVISALLIRAGTAFYDWIQPPAKALVIIEKEESRQNVERVLKAFPQRFQISRVALYTEEKILDSIRQSEAVFFYDVPAGIRTEYVNYCYQHLITVYLNPDIADIVEMSSRQRLFGDVPFLVHEGRKMTFEQRIIKRLMDLFIPAFLLILFSPLFLIIALAIRLEDGGKVFFRQKRATINGRVFEIFKFRTMRENVGNYSVTKDDDRVTKVGRVLRKYRIDELPQLLNIIRGDMSLVGPRPEMLENVSAYERELPEFRYRLRMKAGLTGYAQIMGRYNTSSRDKLILDLLYIENFSILLDIRLLFQTVLVFFNAGDSTEGF